MVHTIKFYHRKKLNHRKNPNVLVFILPITLFFLLAIIYNLSGLLRGPVEWRWVYLPSKTYDRLWFPSIIFFLIISYIVIVFRNMRENLTRFSEIKVLTLLIILSFLFHLGIAHLQKTGGILYLGVLVSDEGATSFHGLAAEYDDNIDYLLKNYEMLMPKFSLHGKTHPPGPILFFWSINSALDKVPMVTDIFYNFLSMRYNFIKYYATKGQAVGCFIAALLISLIGNITIIPLYYLVKKLFEFRVAFLSSIFYLCIPSAVLMNPFLDIIYPLISVSVVYFFILGISTNKYRYSFFGGIFFAFGIFLTFKLLPLLIMILIISILFMFRDRIDPGLENINKEGLKYIVNRSSIIKNLIIFCVSIVIPFLFLFICYDLNILRVFLIALKLHSQITLIPRTYSTWILFNLYDFFIFVGVPLFLIFFWQISKEIRKRNFSDFLTWSFLITLIIINFSGFTLGEVSRLWLFLMPFATIVPARGIIESKENIKIKTIIILLLQALQIVVFKEFIRFP